MFRRHLTMRAFGARDERYEVGRSCFRRGRRWPQARRQGCSPPLSEWRLVVVLCSPRVQMARRLCPLRGRTLPSCRKRGSDADSRIFFDELVSVAASRLKATGAIRLEDRHGIIAFGEKQKLVGVAHTVFENGGSWSYFVCPRCGGRKKKLWLVDDAPRCLSCCWSLGVRYRSAYGFGRAERLSERDRYVDRVQDRRLRGRNVGSQ